MVRGWPGHLNPGESFILKVDPKNGGSQHLVFITASIAPGGGIDAHRHPNADEILFLQTGTARVQLGNAVRDVRAGATIYIPAGTMISATNTGSAVISMIGIFSAPGFEDFMRAASALDGEKTVPLSQAENDAIEKKYMNAVMYKEP